MLVRRQEGSRRLTERVQPVRDLLERDSHKAVPSARTVRVLSHRRTPTVAISPINPHIYLRVFSFLTSRPPPTSTRYPLLVQAGVNRRSQGLPLFPTPDVIDLTNESSSSDDEEH